ncbi:hypothetical protein DIPPA_25239 [Diplonema papillatum]|nr:hypothetical protein DIPPA_25239 [Diplonema papillatum]
MFDNWFNDEDEVATQPMKESDRDAILFMVDCQDSMFIPNKDGDTPFAVAIQCCSRFYKDKILSSDSDFVGLMLYATQHKLNAYDFNGVYIFHSLARPSAQRIKELDSLIADRAAFKQHVGSSSNFPLSDALWTSQHLFHGLPKTIAFRRILVFTDDDNPTRGDQSARDKCVTRARDLLESDITLQLFALKKGLPHQQASASPPAQTGSGQSSSDYLASEPLKGLRGSNSLSISGAVGVGASLDHTHSGGRVSSSGGAGSAGGANSFDAAVFWRDVVYVDDDELAAKAIHLDAKSSFVEMLDPLMRKAHHKRSSGLLNVAFGNQSFEAPAMAVRIYNPVMRARRGTAISLDSKTNIPLVTETRYICHNTAAFLEQDDMGRALDLGTEEVFFDPAEVKSMSSEFGDPGLRILGFKPKSKVKLSQQVGVPYWVHPDEASVTNSSKVFRALVVKMAEMEKVAIAELIPRKGSSPRIVALVPQLETQEPDGSRDECFGMHVIPLPYANDIRDLSFPAPPPKGENHDRLVVKAKQIIRRMQLQPAFDGGEPKYDAYDYPNPALQKHFTVLQSIALEEDYETVPDYTLPDYKSMSSFKDLFASYKAHAYSDSYSPEAAVGTAGMKRSITEYEDCDPKKIDISAVDFEDRYDNEKMGTLTVPILRQYCKNNKEETSGLLKADLVDLVMSIVKEKRDKATAQATAS